MCHSVEIDLSNESYNATSPDEKALCLGAKALGVEFVAKDRNNNIKFEYSLGTETASSK
jgi:hypothetical protein